VKIAGPAGANAGLKVGCLVAGMTAGADSIEDVDVLRHGAMGAVFARLRAPSTLGPFPRSFQVRERLAAGGRGRRVPDGTGPPGAAAAPR